MVGGKVKGMLLDEDRGQRSHIDEEVVITRASVIAPYLGIVLLITFAVVAVLAPTSLPVKRYK